MGKLFTILRRAPKRTSAVLTMVAAAVIIPASLLAWGPGRTMYTIDHPADKITFNSITDNPVVGNETNFVVVKDAANTADGGWQDNITVQPGKEYLVRVYVHNNAATSLNLKATNTRVSASVPTTTAKNVSVSGFVTADNSDPLKVWDDIHFNSDKDFNLAYVAGSAEIYNNGYAKNGASLPDSIVTSTGALVGYNGPDGVVPGCFQYANYVYFKVKPQFAPVNKFETSKQVRIAGQTAWSESVNANIGDTVEYQIKYQNTGETVQNNVVVKDFLPNSLSYIKGSTYLKNGNNPTPKNVSDNLMTSGGINIGGYNPGAAGYLKFSAKVVGSEALECGKNTLVNKEQTIVDNGYLEDTANVVVNKECQPGDVSVCVLATKKIVTINESDFDSKTMSKDLSDCVELPHTGPTENIVAMIGLGALVASIGYYVASRRVGLNQ
ncbi:MAG TPA: DUF11 domain-containing protein [Candidatus Saccharibacteria bacterium]|mgnify:CR=1 FL=1|nr:DUF11 domain-containing protein [Candidatus Saccharibacteria bacterium]HRQ07308.1 DUF11 domain-containing protein [Candidatus Saccharibacteria bacterium]